MNKLEQATALCRNDVWLFHRESLTVGRAMVAYPESEYLSPINGQPVDAVVIQLHTGDHFTFTPEAFATLTESEARFYKQAQEILQFALSQLAGIGQAMAIDPERGVALVTAAVHFQARTMGTVRGL